MKKFAVIIALAFCVLALCACTDMSGTNSGGMNSGSLSSSLQDAESMMSSLLSQSGASVFDSSGAVTVSRDSAIEKALTLAGLKREDVTDLEAELDYDREGVFWEVDFNSKTEEFSYDINAKTGEVTKSQREARD